MWGELHKTLTDLGFIEAKCTAGMAYELVSDYLRACTEGEAVDGNTNHELYQL